ncbi:MAG: DUF4198 domain-containing protein [Haliea sp.]|nr:MAG: DUF4198 domain-containing protein [Haliea sp.]
MKKNLLPSFRAIALVSSLLMLGTAQAHHVWIEQTASGAQLFFGEFGDNMREVSPGLLDKFGGPVAQRISAKGSETLTVNKTATGFGLSARAAKGESIVAEDPAYPSFEVKQGDKTGRGIYVPAARLVTDLNKQEPKLTLDLVPTGVSGKDGTEFQAFFKGQPLPKAKVEVITPSGWSQAHTTDEQGKIKTMLPWSGTYVLEMSHNDRNAGERAGEKYDRASYVTSLTINQPGGLKALPAPAAAAPSKAN